MSAARLESFLAKIYVYQPARERFLQDPQREAQKAGLSEQEIAAVLRIDRAGLLLMAESLSRKHARRFSRY